MLLSSLPQARRPQSHQSLLPHSTPAASASAASLAAAEKRTHRFVWCVLLAVFAGLAGVLFLVHSFTTAAVTRSHLHAAQVDLQSLAVAFNAHSLQCASQASNEDQTLRRSSVGVPAQQVLVLYVHDRPHYFARVVASLRAVTGIEHARVFISHDSAHGEMLRLVQTINFTRVTQLIHPRRPHTQLGDDDDRGIARLKRHWWWLLETVFQTLEQQHAWVTLIEEDHVVSSDLLLMAAHLQQRYRVDCPECWGASLYSPDVLATPFDAAQLVVTRGTVGWPVGGWMFDRRFWRALQQHADAFHRCRDGWDMSLVRLQSIGLLPVGYLYPAVSRVRNIGQHGMNVDARRYHTLGLAHVRLASELTTQDELDRRLASLLAVDPPPIVGSAAYLVAKATESECGRTTWHTAHFEGVRPLKPMISFAGRC